LKFSPINDPVLNPLMGWAPWATIKSSEQPHTLVYADLTWREFEPQEGVFDFSAFETRNQLQRWREEGKRVVFRFVLDKPGREAHIDIPDWLFERIQADGDIYDIEYGKGFSPNYANPVLISCHQKAIQALGDRYGGEDFFAYIELGSLGHWGEWQIKSNTNIHPLPSAAIRDQFVAHYLQAFPQTHLLMRRPFVIAASHGMGLYNDMTGDYEATSTWLGWISSGGEYSQTGELYALSPMRDGWQVAPIGGEQTPNMDDEEIYLSKLDQTMSLLRASHTTFIGPGGPYDISKGGSLQAGMDLVQATIGYRLYVKQFQLPRQVYWGNQLHMKMIFSNDGIAPMYYAWPVQLYLLAQNGDILAQYPLDLDVRRIIPGEEIKISHALPINQLKNGIYYIGIAVLDPLTGQPAVRFAMQSARHDRIQELGTFEIKRDRKSVV
jgi:hypothetical protein